MGSLGCRLPRRRGLADRVGIFLAHVFSARSESFRKPLADPEVTGRAGGDSHDVSENCGVSARLIRIGTGARRSGGEIEVI